MAQETQVTQLRAVTNSPSTPKLNSWSAPRELNDGTGRLLSAIDRLYARFDGLYMHRWKSNFPNVAAIENWKDTWAQGFCRHGITLHMALEGLVKCETEHPWAPSMPEFIALCQAPFDFEAAFHEAINQLRIRHESGEDRWSHPAIYWAAQDFGPFELRNVSYKQAEAKWKRLLDKRIGSECEPVPAFALQLAAPARDEAGVAISSAEAKEQARVAIAQMAAKKPSREIALERAQAVLARREAGEPVTTLQISHARAVLAQLGSGQGSEAA